MTRSLQDMIKESTECKVSGENAWREGDFNTAIAHYKKSTALLKLFLDSTKQGDNKTFQKVYGPVEEKIKENLDIVSRLEKGEKYKPKMQTVNGSSGENGAKDNPEMDSDTQKLYDQIKMFVVHEKTGVKFTDLIGLDEVIVDMKKYIIMPLMHPHIFKGIGKTQTNFLLHGAPGTGKTHLLRAVATEVDATFLQLSGASLKSKYVGESEKIINCLFQYAREMSKEKPVILFIDEVDSVAMKRGGESNTNSNALNQLLIEMDGFGSSSNIFLFAATNRPFDLDDAFLRRLQRKFYMKLPDFNARIKLWTLYLFNTADPLKPIIDQEMLKILAQKTENYSPADISNLCQAARMSAAEQTAQSEYFALFNVDGESKYVPVGPGFNNAEHKNISDIPPEKLVRMPVTMQHVEDQLRTYKKGVRDENLKLYQDFQDTQL